MTAREILQEKREAKVVGEAQSGVADLTGAEAV